ncbi:radical SAM protein [uncultured Lamprocystis sp.]|jgi:sulfatase maturation enzyme AslB (radical SAM superfamily)|uniref:radical SAM protein n=1 Tax=uncultured Lamprocystis sp. TaxID=543132 RepID=UPI0025DE2161|nr:radical SAM protein [uncultured Lamprocystis sp.]
MANHDDSLMRSLQFLVTEDCNLRCVYCYEKHKTAKSLPVDFIKAKIRDEMLADNGYAELSIEFFGGEPLLRFDAIREVVDWFRDTDWSSSSKTYRFVITTNGSLLTDTMKDWFSRKSNDITLCLSMDGLPEAQNRNRSNSSAAVLRHIPFFRELWPTQPVKMTVSPYTLDKMYDGVVYIHSLGLPVESNIVFEDVWGSEDSKRMALRVYAEQLDKLVSFYHTHPQLTRPKMLFHNLLGLYVSDAPKDVRDFCGAGKHLFCYSADGKQYPCMRFAPICTARPLEDIGLSIRKVTEKCESCMFERLCPTCQGHNFEVTGSCFARTDFHCDFFKLELLASAKLCLLDDSKEQAEVDAGQVSERGNLIRLQKLLAVRAINDLCQPVTDL